MRVHLRWIPVKRSVLWIKMDQDMVSDHNPKMARKTADDRHESSKVRMIFRIRKAWSWGAMQIEQAREA